MANLSGGWIASASVWRYQFGQQQLWDLWERGKFQENAVSSPQLLTKAQCITGSTCSSSACVCTNSGKPPCNGTCPDLTSDNNNCGACGHSVCTFGLLELHFQSQWFSDLVLRSGSYILYSGSQIGVALHQRTRLTPPPTVVRTGHHLPIRRLRPSQRYLLELLSIVFQCAERHIGKQLNRKSAVSGLPHTERNTGNYDPKRLLGGTGSESVPDIHRSYRE